MSAHHDVAVAVIGASLGGVLAAWQACAELEREGRAPQTSRVLLTAEFEWIGGQLTAQGVPPDEHRLIEHGGATRSYRAFRQAIRDHYRGQREFQDRTHMTEGCNPGDGWVSRLCFEPRVAVTYLEALLAPHVGSGRLLILRGARPVAALRDGRHLREVTVNVHAQGLESLQRIRATLFLDGTDTGELLPLVQLPYRLGKEGRGEFQEALAPAVADRQDQQPVTHVIALRRHDRPVEVEVTPDPEAYAFWRAHIVPHYGFAQFSDALPGSRPGESIRLPLFAHDEADSTLDMWRYRRIVARHMWSARRDEVSLINWAQNDYALHPLLEGSTSTHEVESAARQLSLCLLHWLRHDAPRNDAAGRVGYPELSADAQSLGTADGLSQQVYVRESRRLVGLSTLSQGDIAVPTGAADPARAFAPVHLARSVGVAWYNMDIHPTCVSGQGLNARVRPFTLPVGVFLNADIDNLLPACKNISVTHLVNAATRVHPVEWLVGEVAGLLAVHVLVSAQPLRALHDSASAFEAFAQRLHTAGIDTQWDPQLIERLVVPAAARPSDPGSLEH